MPGEPVNHTSTIVRANPVDRAHRAHDVQQLVVHIGSEYRSIDFATLTEMLMTPTAALKGTTNIAAETMRRRETTIIATRPMTLCVVESFLVNRMGN
jgi:hypothetical protein